MVYSICFTYYDDVLDCGCYAYDIATYDNYRDARKAYYLAIKNYDSEPVGIETDFKIKPLDKFLHGDFVFSVRAVMCDNSQWNYSNFFRALICLFIKNKNLPRWIFKAIFVYKVKYQAILDFIKIGAYKMTLATRY